MAVSDVFIANLALQKLGAKRIASFDDDTVPAEEISACYEHIRQKCIRKYKPRFAILRTTLAPDATVPEFEFSYAFVLPAGYLKLLRPNRLGLDWQIENHLGDPAILTNETNALEIRYLADITDPTKFDSSFTELFACEIADHLCEKITQSNTKKGTIKDDKKDALAQARRDNAFETGAEDAPQDSWVAIRNVNDDQLREANPYSTS